MISCPLSLFLVASKSSESEMLTDPPGTLAAVLQSHCFLLDVKHPTRKLMSYNNLCNSIASMELPVIKHFSLQKKKKNWQSHGQ